MTLNKVECCILLLIGWLMNIARKIILGTFATGFAYAQTEQS